MNHEEEIASLKKELVEQRTQLKHNEFFFNESTSAVGILRKEDNPNPRFWITNFNKAFVDVTEIKSKSKKINLTTLLGAFDNFDTQLLYNILNNSGKVIHSISLNKSNQQFNLKIQKISDLTYRFLIDELPQRIKENNHSIGANQTITDDISTRNKLKISEERFRSVFTNSPIAIILVNKEISPILSNEQFCNMTGYSKSEIISMSLKDFTHHEDFKANLNLYKQLFNKEINHFTLTKRYIKKNKEIIWVKVTVSASQNNETNSESAIVMVQDISAEKKATTELVKSEYKYRTLIENANDGIGLFDENFKPILYNTSLYGALGFDIDTYLTFDHSKFELFHPEDVIGAKKAYLDVKNGIRSRIEKRLRHNDGSYKYFSISYIPVIHEEKPATLIFRRDISKRKVAEEQNEEYRLFLETLMDNLPVSIYAKTTPDFRYLYYNKTMEKLSGISAEDAIGQSDFELTQFKKDAKKYNDEDKKILRTKQKLENEYSFTNVLGELKQFRSIKTLHIPSIGNPIILGIAIDVTKLREAENMIEQSSHIIKEAQKIAKLGYWEYDVEKDLIFDTPENRQILDTQNLTYFLNFKQLVDIIHPSDRERIQQSFKECIKNKTEGDEIVKINVANKIKHISINYKPILNDTGNISKVRGTTMDITRIRSSEIALKDSEYKLKQAEHIAKVGYWNHDFEKDETQFSDEVWNLLDIKEQEQPINFIEFFNNVHPDDKVNLNLQYIKQRSQNKPFDIDFRIITSQNKTKYIKSKGTFVINKYKKPIRSIGIFQDITLIKEKEIALEHSASHLLEVQKLSKTGYIEIQYDDNKTIFSDTIWDIIEQPKQSEVSQLEFNKFIHPQDIELVNKTLQETLKTGTSHNINYRIILSSNKTKYINEIGIIGEHKNPTHKYATRVVQDITTLKEQDIQLKESISDLEIIKNSDEQGFWEFNTESKEFFLSPELKKILNIKSNKNTFPFQKIISFIHPNDQFSIKKILTDHIEKKENYTLSYRIVSEKTKTIKHLKDIGTFNKNEKGQWVLKGFIKDITETKKKEIELLESNDLLEAFADNSLIATFIYSDKKLLYANKKWDKLVGSIRENNSKHNRLSDLLKPSTIEILKSLFTNWNNFKVNEYHNKIEIAPLQKKKFQAEIYVKEVLINGKKAFLTILYDL